ncbi:type III pantothenate kinase [Spirosoma sp. KUDC1026]|uniref:type III pantothenate kinase n=1 Tax=Spirosoma sp. KUDC1026 TaxID=2745947 RepID=UPI001E4095C1|nr:type III pantothenate kinase [Spirosoma sp. KUDC1026]
MINLVIDWGNTRLKAGWFAGDQLIEISRYESIDELLNDSGVRQAAQPINRHVLVSSTAQSAALIGQGLGRLNYTVLVLNGQTPLPIRNGYGTPQTLGADRVAAAVGAAALFPERDCLILDLGTCLTADLIDREGTFQGGLISPGLRMRLRAMHEQTARLPLIDWKPDELTDWPSPTAKNTRDAMLSGVLNGLLLEMNGLIDQYRHDRPEMVVVLCGGDASVFESRLKPPIFAMPELVLTGLNRILRYNVENLQANTPDVNA